MGPHPDANRRRALVIAHIPAMLPQRPLCCCEPAQARNCAGTALASAGCFCCGAWGARDQLRPDILVELEVTGKGKQGVENRTAAERKGQKGV